MNKRSIIWDMRNIVKCYRLCKFVYDNAKFHNCGSDKCEAHAVIGAPIFNDKKLKKLVGKTREEAASYIDNLLLFRGFAKSKGYIEQYYCDKQVEYIVKLTDEGIRLTGNLLLPFTPVNLWKEIWKEHKVVFSIFYGIIASALGGGVFGIVKAITAITTHRYN